VRQRVEVGKKRLASELAPASHLARALLVSRQYLYRPRRVRRPIAKPVPQPMVREVGAAVRVSPATMTVEGRLVVLAPRHVAFGYRVLWSKLAEPATA
jgi:hypothetical protein